MGGWFMPGFFMVVVVAVILWLIFRRQPAPAPTQQALSCPKCTGGVHASYFRCPHCGEALKHNCPNCSRIIEHDWSYCPYCNEHQQGSVSAESTGH
jgi:RNA polymerase subunit RPABC4/transcription elongation factor Spt4